MKNLAHLPEERLEVLDTRRPIRPDPETQSDRRRKPYHAVRRFLEAHIGQPWDAVESKFLKTFPLNPTLEPMEILEGEVEVHTFVGKDGNIWAYTDFPMRSRAEIQITGFAHSSNTFYVHPGRRTLELERARKTNYRALRRQREEKWLRRLGPWHQLQRIKGIWFELKVEGMERLKLRDYGPDDIINPREPFPHDWWRNLTDKPKQYKELGPAPKLVKRQLNSKEIRERQLPNGALVKTS